MDGGNTFPYEGPETVKVREQYVTVLDRGKFRSSRVAAHRWRRVATDGH